MQSSTKQPDEKPTYDQGNCHSSEGVVRLGISAIKGVGDSAAESIIAERKNGKFTSLYDFVSRIDLKKVPKSSIVAMIKAGAFASI